ncbi:NAD(P)(+) transhydrogenase (Re/Si-specific) subunit beta [Luteibacter yeojuensis]
MISMLVDVSGFAAALLFILGMKRMASPATAVHGIWLTGIGMVVAVVVSFGYLSAIPVEARPHALTNVALALAALALGGGWAWWRGRRVAVTAMPQMVALYNGMGGGAAAAVAAVELMARDGGEASAGILLVVVTALGALIGSVSLSGSIVAWAKLDGRLERTFRFRGQSVVNGSVFLLALGVAAWALADPSQLSLAIFFAVALLLGVLMTVPIGGADMPVVISLYNAFTGLAVALEGYALSNPALMVAGMMVGSAGTLLTLLMAKAMNRSLANVLFSRFGDPVAGSTAAVAGHMKSVDARDAALTMRYATTVIVVPGYGLAVAQAQAKLYELVKLLQAAGVAVRFAIHPVAGRMPGHMNVLLAEAGVPYDLIDDMEDINDSFKSTDVAIVIGANDVVNPAARSDKASPIYGMPILNADQARQVYVVKRGQGKGYAGVENLLFYQDNCAMVYGDALAVLNAMVQAIKEQAA